jgi:DNA repair exonuclease SbcCD nuclease subunit
MWRGKMGKVRWLHLSDIHFGYKADIVENMRFKMLERVKSIGRIDYLFITGDLRFGKVEREGYPRETIQFIEDLMRSLKLDRKNVFLVSGNHDVNRSDELKAIISSAKSKYKTSKGEISKTTLNFIQEQRKPFADIYEEICGRKEPEIHYSIETEHYNIIHINTALFSCSDDEQGELILGTQLLRNMTKSLNKNKPCIVLAHHSLDSLTPDEQRELEIILKENNSVLYLCGHKHQALSGNIKIHRQDIDLWMYICGTNMDKDSSIEETDMDIFVGEIDPENHQGNVKAYKWSRKSSSWMQDSDFSYAQNQSEDGTHYFPPNSRPISNLNIDSTIPTSNLDIDSRIINKYLDYVKHECNEIQLNGLPVDMDIGQSKISLEKLFIPLKFKKYDERRNSLDDPFFLGYNFKDQELMLDNIISTSESFRALLFSKPGSGKTTLLKWIATSNYCLSQVPEINKNFESRKLFPIWIKCRNFDNNSKPTIFDLVSDIWRRAELSLNSDEKGKLEANIKAHIKNGTALLLIDGIDEINSDGGILGFLDQLERFISSNPNIKIITTSRINGYEKIFSNNLQSFQRYEILPFTDDNIMELCLKWYQLVNGISIENEEKAKKIARSIIEHERIRSFATNPLLLTTLLLVERRVGRFPNKRANLYSDAIQVLLETWNLEVYGPIDLDEAKYQLAYIAFQMIKEKKQIILESQLKKLLVDARKEFSDLFSKDSSVSTFIKKIERRSALLVQTGQIEDENGKSDSTYEFQHLTFQEYLAAYALSSSCYHGASEEESMFTALDEMLLDNNMREVVLLTAAQLPWPSVKKLVELMMSKYKKQGVSLENRQNIRRMLIQLVVDEVPMGSNENVESILEVCFGNGFWNSDYEFIKLIISGKKSELFKKYCSKLDKKRDIDVPIISNIIKFAKGDLENGVRIYEDGKNSTDINVLLNAIMALEHDLWIEQSPNAISRDSWITYSSEMFGFLLHNDSRIRFLGFHVLRLIPPQFFDVDNYINSIVKFIEDFSLIPRINIEVIAFIVDDAYRFLPKKILSTSSVELILSKIGEIEIDDISEYQVIFTWVFLITAYSDYDLLKVYDLIKQIRTSVWELVGYEWKKFMKVDGVLISLLKPLLKGNHISPSNKTEIRRFVKHLKEKGKTFIEEKNPNEMNKKVINRRLIEALYPERSSSYTKSDNIERDFDIEEIIRRIDKRIAELEAEELLDR